MFKQWFSTAAVSALGLLLSPGIGSAQMRGVNSGNVTGLYTGISRGSFGSGGYGYGGGYRSGGIGYGGYGYGGYGGSYMPYYSYPAPAYSYYYTPQVYSEPTSQFSYYNTPVPATTNTASIEVRVPAGAEIWFDDDKTSQTGSVRNFASPPLEPGKTFTYEIRARWTDGDKPVEKTRKVKVQAGQQSVVDFLQP